jgi:hypothetical protein
LKRTAAPTTKEQDVSSSRDASLPPPPSEVPTTRRSPARPASAMATVAMSEVAPGVGPERASTGVPVERSVTRASLGPRALVPVIGVVVAAVVVAVIVAGWVLVGRGGPGGGAGGDGDRDDEQRGGIGAGGGAGRRSAPRDRPK